MKISHLVEEVARVGRKHRSPKNPFHVRHLPWDLQPFCIHPVLPGETLQNALLQVRAITDPIKNPLIGWWLEHYLFYVKLADIEDAGIEAANFFKGMLIDPTKDLHLGAMYTAFANASTYKAAVNGYDWGWALLGTVVKSYFRDEDEWVSGSSLAPTNSVSAMPICRAKPPGRDDWMNSLMKDDVEATPATLTGADPDDPNVATAYQEAYDRMVQMGATTLTYQDWLRSFGIHAVETRRPGRPELLRYSRSWQYPSSHVDAVSGAVNSVVSWAIDERADKKRFFKEPGFVFGVTTARPKVYLSQQVQSASQLLDNAFTWLPATLRDRPEYGLKKILAAAGPLAGKTGAADYWVDVRDLFIYGDQFVGGAGFTVAATDAGLVALPDGTGGTLTKAKRLYATQTMLESLFTSTAATGTAPGRLVKQDGSLDLHLLTAESDPT